MRHLADKMRSILLSAYTTQLTVQSKEREGQMGDRVRGGGVWPPMAVDLTIQFRLESVISNCYS